MSWPAPTDRGRSICRGRPRLPYRIGRGGAPTEPLPRRPSSGQISKELENSDQEGQPFTVRRAAPSCRMRRSYARWLPPAARTPGHLTRMRQNNYRSGCTFRRGEAAHFDEGTAMKTRNLWGLFIVATSGCAMSTEDDSNSIAQVDQPVRGGTVTNKRGVVEISIF